MKEVDVGSLGPKGRKVTTVFQPSPSPVLAFASLSASSHDQFKRVLYEQDALKEVGFLNKMDHPSIISYNVSCDCLLCFACYEIGGSLVGSLVGLSECHRRHSVM
jgi:hypothetical protein